MARSIHSRRALLAAMATTALTAPSFLHAADEILHPATAPAAPGRDPWRGLKAGIASYSFRKLPLDVTIAGIKRLDMHYVSIKDTHLPMKSTTEQRKAVVAQCKDAGITPISCGVVTMTADPANIRHAFEYARDLGVPTMVCLPDPSSFATLDAMVKEFDIKLAIHNHGPEAPHFKSPLEVWKAVQDHDERIGLCVDVGHTARAGVEPVDAIHTCAARVYDIHMKDITRRDAMDGSVEIEIGRGVLDIRGILQALLDIQFGGHLGFEHERTAENPLPGIAESVGYVKGVLSCGMKGS
jgi:sugar phosphate isomerase/epimerase